MFLVSPYHPEYEVIAKTIPKKAQDGFSWREKAEEGTVWMAHDDNAGRMQAP